MLHKIAGLMSLEEVENYDFDNLDFNDCFNLNQAILLGCVAGFLRYGGTFVFGLLFSFLIPNFMFPGIIVAVLLGLAYITDRGTTKRWTKVGLKFRSKILRITVNSIFPGSELGSATTPYDFWMQFKALPHGNITDSGNYIVKDNFRYEEYTVKHKYENHKGETEINTLFKGFIVQNKVNIPIQSNVRILSSYINMKKEVPNCFPKCSDNECKVDVENIMFNNNFEIYAESEQDAFYVVSPYVTEKLLELKKVYKDFQCVITPTQILLSVDYGSYPLSTMISFKQDTELQDLELYKVLNTVSEVQKSLAIYLTGGVV